VKLRVAEAQLSGYGLLPKLRSTQTFDCVCCRLALGCYIICNELCLTLARDCERCSLAVVNLRLA